MPVLSGYDQITNDFYKLPDGSNNVTVKTAKLVTFKTKTGSARKLEVSAATHDGNSVKIDTILPMNDAEWQGWKEGRKKFFKGQLQALGLTPTDLDTDHGRGKIIGQRYEVDSSKNDTTGYQNYKYERCLSDSSNSLPSAADVLASQFDATPVETPVSQDGDENTVTQDADTAVF